MGQYSEYPIYYNRDIPPYYFYLVPMTPLQQQQQLRLYQPPESVRETPPKVPLFNTCESPPKTGGSPILKRRRSSNPWNFEEDSLLCHLRDEKGLSWKEISPFFPTRTINGCQLRYRRITSLTKHHTASTK